MTEDRPPTSPPSPPVAIDEDILCLSCGYNLRGLSSAGKCPECGTIINASLRGDLLKNSDPAWVRRISRGASLAYLGIMVIIVGFILTVISTIGLSLLPGSQAVQAGIMAVWVFVWLVGGFGSALVGAWLMTGANPRESAASQGVWVRIGSRVGLLAFLALYASTWGKYPWWLWQGLYWTTWLVLVAWLMVFVSLMAGLARQLPSAEVLKTCQTARRRLWIAAGLAVLLLAPRALAAVAGVAPTGTQPAGTLQNLLANPIVATTLTIGRGVVVIVLIMAASTMEHLLRRCRRAFREAADQAKLNWIISQEKTGTPGGSSNGERDAG